jgi:hypothetical protein
MTSSSSHVFMLRWFATWVSTHPSNAPKPCERGAGGTGGGARAAPGGGVPRLGAGGGPGGAPVGVAEKMAAGGVA